MAQFLRPTSDIATASWNGTFADIDEVTASDADYGYSTDNVEGNYETKFGGAITDPEVGTGHVLRARFGISDGGVLNNGGNTLTISVGLYQGATLIEEVETNYNVVSNSTHVYTIATANANNITDYTDLRVRFNYNKTGGSPANRRGLSVSWAEMEIPDYVAPTTDFTKVKVNIADAWKDGADMKINIGDVWKDVVDVWQNIGDVWKKVT